MTIILPESGDPDDTTVPSGPGVLTFKEIQDAVLSDRFAESKRGAAKHWINSRYGRLWAMEPWSFKLVAVEADLDADDGTVTLASLGLQRVHAVYGGVGAGFYSLVADRPEDYHTYARTTGGSSYSFTVIGNTIILDKANPTAQTLTIVGEAKWAALVEDTDVPLIPSEFHWALVLGATSEGLRVENDPTWQGPEHDWMANIVDMRNSYLTNVSTFGDSSPTWAPYIGW